MLIARGDDDTFKNNFRTFGHKLDKTYPCVSSNPFGLDIRISKFPGMKSKEKMQRTLTVCANRNNMGIVERMLENASKLK